MKRKINHIIIHCAATPNGQHFSVGDIDAMHKARGFNRNSQWARNFNPTIKHVGYHYVIEIDGTIKPGRHLEEIGAHVQGANSKSVGICMIGTDKFTLSQFNSLRQIINQLALEITRRHTTEAVGTMTAFKDYKISVKGHRDYSPDRNGNGIIERTEWLKICPGFSVAEWLNGGMIPLESALL